MKKMKKFLAMLLAMTMVMGLSLTAFAAGDGTTLTNGKPAPGDKGVVKVTGTQIKNGNVSFKAYQIIEPIFNEPGIDGFAGYRWVNATTGKNTKVEYAKNKDGEEIGVVGLDSAEVERIASSVISSNGITPIVTWEGTTVLTYWYLW